jgi:hypothetical protein
MYGVRTVQSSRKDIDKGHLQCQISRLVSRPCRKSRGRESIMATCSPLNSARLIPRSSDMMAMYAGRGGESWSRAQGRASELCTVVMSISSRARAGGSLPEGKSAMHRARRPWRDNALRSTSARTLEIWSTLGGYSRAIFFLRSPCCEPSLDGLHLLQRR